MTEVRVVSSLPSLGQATAIDFLNWVAENPAGVISLPTGRTPEYFIKSVESILSDYPGALSRFPTLLSPTRPDTTNLVFFQMDEFVPFRPTDRLFKKFIHRFYVPLLNLKPENVHTIDFDEVLGQSILDVFPSGQIDFTSRSCRSPFSLPSDSAKAVAVLDAFCDEYEQRIRDAGGLGFILLGVGPDGHVAYNCFGSSRFSTTRLAQLNYPTKAAAAGDLGGVDSALNLSAITIGLSTILTANKISVFAAGESKSGIIARSLEEYDTPLGVVLKTGGDKCSVFLTEGAAKRLNPTRGTAMATADLMTKVNNGLRLLAEAGCTIIHTEPHHDDILLGYYPLLEAWLRPSQRNVHHVLSLTAGFNSVADRWLTPEQRSDGNAALHKSEIRRQEGLGLWRYLGVDEKNVKDLKLPFYTADIFAPEPKYASDVLPVVHAIQDILSVDGATIAKNQDGTGQSKVWIAVLTDPESSGPDTHFKCLLAVAKALEHLVESGELPEVKVLCYRNVWTSFDFEEVDALIPVQEETWQAMKTAFLEFYKTQASAEFPSAEFEGDFASYALLKGNELGERVLSAAGRDVFADPIPSGFIGVQVRTVRQLAEIAGDRLKNFIVNGMASDVKVFLRLKPGPQSLTHTQDAVVLGDRKYVFQSVFGPRSTQADVFEAVARPAVQSVLQGYNASVFAYGASGCGKTHTLMAEEGGGGILQRSLRALFEEISADPAVQVKVSCLEIYLESVSDLLSPGNRNLPVREDGDGRVYVQGLTEISVSAATEAEAFLVQAVRSRTTAATLSNSHSSRSHCVFILEISRDERHGGTRSIRRAKLNIVDLAGSERHGNMLTGNSRETGSINKSLFALTGVVQALIGNSFVPYRDSKLTYLLKDSLGGNTKTSFVLVADPSNTLYSRSSTTLETLSFGERLLLVKNHAVVNETLTVNDATIEALTAEIRVLKAQLGDLHTAAESGDFGMRERRLQALLVGLLDRVRDTERRAVEFKAQAQSWEAQANNANKALEAMREFEYFASSRSQPPVTVPNFHPFFPNPISLETPFKRQAGSFNAPIVSARAPSPGPFMPMPFSNPFLQGFLTPRSFSPAPQAHSQSVSFNQSSPAALDEVQVLRQLLENHPERAKRVAAEERARRAEDNLAEERRKFAEYKSWEQQNHRLLARQASTLMRTKSSRMLSGANSAGSSRIEESETPRLDVKEFIEQIEGAQTQEVAALKVKLELAEDEIAYLLKARGPDANIDLRTIIRS